MQPQMNTLYQLIQASGCDYCIFEFGRRVQPITKTEFEQFENGDMPYPYPIQKTAKFALVYWPIGAKHNPFIWFMNLPLDEESKVVGASRNHFVAIIQEALGSQIAAKNDQAQQALPDNPYIKAPDQKKLAIINAQLKHKLALPYSTTLNQVVSMFEQANFDSWQTCPMQAMADFIVQLDNTRYQSLLTQHFFDLPEDFRFELASFLEHQTLGKALSRKIIASLKQDFTDSANTLALVRCLASQSNNLDFQQLLTQAFQTKQSTIDSVEFLSIICARHWPALTNPLLLDLFLEHIAASDKAGLFTALFTDLVALPQIRRLIFMLMQNPSALPKTRQAVNLMVKETYGSTH